MTASIPVGRFPGAIAVGERSIWVANFGYGSVSNVDPATDAVVGRIEVGGSPQAVDEAGGTLWIAGPSSVVRVDRATGARSTHLAMGQVRDMASSDGALWVLDQSRDFALARVE